MTTTASELGYGHHLIEELRTELEQIGVKVNGSIHLADLIRQGSKVTKQAQGWGDGENACALGAALIAVEANGIKP